MSSSSRLLPSSVNQFGKQNFWDQFFSELKKKPFEWYSDYKQLKVLIRKFLPETAQQPRILVAGCGNSDLSAELYDDGFLDIANVDFSPVVIKEMKMKNSRRAGMKWEVMDLKNLTYETGTFDMILDKGLVDAVISDETQEVEENVRAILLEAQRVLKDPSPPSSSSSSPLAVDRKPSCYFCVSLAQEHVIRKFFQCFQPLNQWSVKVFQLSPQSDASQALVPFAIVVQKRIPLEGENGSEVFIDLFPKDIDPETPIKVQSVAMLIERIGSIQMASRMGQQLRSIQKGQSLQLDFQDESLSTRYRLFIVDSKDASFKKNSCAILIVPQGREHEWLFSNSEGQEQLAQSVQVQRLIIVHMQRGQSYPNGLQGVQDELSPQVTHLIPSGCKDKVPYVTVSSDLGERKIIWEGESSLSGKMVVEDVSSEEQGQKVHCRRLIFLNNPNVIQSEVKLLAQGDSFSINHGLLTFDHHKALTIAMSYSAPSLLGSISPLHTLVIGLGGGMFPLFLHKHFSQMKVDVVELDPSILQVAQETFGFVQDDRLKVIIEDGLLFVKRNALPSSEPTPDSSSSSSSSGGEAKKYHFLIIDVDSKDTTVGMSCPPEAFVDQVFLEEVKRLLMLEAMLLLNLVCRSDQIYQRVMATIRSVFGSDVVVFQWKDDVNRIVAVFHRDLKVDEIPQRVLSGAPLKKQITSLNSVVSLPFDPALELVDLLDDLDISAPFRPKEPASKAAGKPKGPSGGGGGGGGGKHKRGKGKPKRKY